MAPTLLVSWLLICCGLVSGAAVGLFFARVDWLGGYGSWRRRLLRLGHIAFFGMAALNLAFLFTLPRLEQGVSLVWTSWLLVLAGIGMPLTCFASAWRRPLRRLFALPVSCDVVAVVFILERVP
jgi:hypothetical protein